MSPGMRPHRTLLLLSGVLALTCAYHRQSRASGVPCTDLAVQVSAGTQPTFRWARECPVERLQVTRAGSEVICWTTFSRDRTNALSPPVRYGIAPPAAARTMHRLELLEPGTTYQVSLYRVFEGGGAPRVVGTRSFTP